MKVRIHVCDVETVIGNIAAEQVDAIVNAANNELWMGSGVAGALLRTGGKEIETEAVVQGPIEVGEAVVTSAGHLQARFVIHAAAMGRSTPATYSSVKLATRSALLLCAERKIRSISFPALGAGIGGLDMAMAAEAMVEEIVRAGNTYAQGVRLVRIVVRSEEARRPFDQRLLLWRDRITCNCDVASRNDGKHALWCAANGPLGA